MAVNAANQQQVMHTLQDLGANVIYLMGFSFILGSLFTILILIMLDFLRRNDVAKAKHGE
jgi:hypothetical protein